MNDKTGSTNNETGPEIGGAVFVTPADVFNMVWVY
jgi:hypothetical protein